VEIMMAATVQEIVSMLAGWTVEVTPASAAKVEDFAAILPAGTIVNVTALPGSELADTVAVAERLRAEGMEPVPHIAARSLPSEAALDGYLADLVARAGVREVLVIGGGVDRPVGPYAETMSVLRSGLLAEHGIRKVGVAGHPEGSPDIKPAMVAKALAEKNDWARENGVEMYIETQFCFEPEVVIAWERKIRAEGNRLSIRVGVPGLATLKTLLRFAQMSGVGPSMRVLTRQARNLAKLLLVQAPDGLVAGLAAARKADPDCLIESLHFYPFGGLARTVEWVDAVADGRIVPTAKGFSVDDGAVCRAS
jgi:methylenetetrahydrofolate reductase (NADPH)